MKTLEELQDARNEVLKNLEKDSPEYIAQIESWKRHDIKVGRVKGGSDAN